LDAEVANPTGRIPQREDAHSQDASRELVPRIETSRAKAAGSHAAKMIGRWAKSEWKWLVGIVLTIILSSLAFERCNSALRPTPLVTQIKADAWEVPEGDRVKLTAETYPKDNRPSKYDWSPADKIEGEGQSVFLNTKTTERHTESYEIKVSLQAKDQYGRDVVSIEPIIIKVVPRRQWNHKPELREPVHTDKKEIRAGDPVTLEALAYDKDDDKLSYDWSVDSDLVRIEGNGKRRITLFTPSDIARRALVLLKVKLTVRDGYEDGNAVDDVMLTITPKPIKWHPKKGPSTPTTLIITLQEPSARQGNNSNASPTDSPKPSANPPSQQESKIPESRASPAQP
jgi:hypothetical protein